MQNAECRGVSAGAATLRHHLYRDSSRVQGGVSGIVRAVPFAIRAVSTCGLIRHNGCVITRGVEEYVARDWHAVRQAKDEYWVDRIERLGPFEGFRIADELRRQVMLQDPSWPRAEQRREDLAAHVRLSGAFRRADSAGGR